MSTCDSAPSSRRCPMLLTWINKSSQIIKLTILGQIWTRFTKVWSTHGALILLWCNIIFRFLQLKNKLLLKAVSCSLKSDFPEWVSSSVVEKCLTKIHVCSILRWIKGIRRRTASFPPHFISSTWNLEASLEREEQRREGCVWLSGSACRLSSTPTGTEPWIREAGQKKEPIPFHLCRNMTEE